MKCFLFLGTFLAFQAFCVDLWAKSNRSKFEKKANHSLFQAKRKHVFVHEGDPYLGFPPIVDPTKIRLESGRNTYFCPVGYFYSHHLPESERERRASEFLLGAQPFNFSPLLNSGLR